MEKISFHFDDVEKNLKAKEWFYNLKTNTKEEEEYKEIIGKEIRKYSEITNKYIGHLETTNNLFIEIQKQLFKIIRKIGKIDE